MQFVVLSSSRGTTFQAVLDRIKDGSLTAQCMGLITDRGDRGCIAKAEAAGLPVIILPRMEGESREEYDRRLDEEIRKLMTGNTPRDAANPHPARDAPPSPTPRSMLLGEGEGGTFIAALGWMFILTPWFIQRWKDRIINVHPALLPKFGGAKMYGDRVHQAVLDSGDTESGITIHLMDEGVDTGKILLQKMCPVMAGDTVETLKERVQRLEREWYPRVLAMMDQTTPRNKS